MSKQRRTQIEIGRDMITFFQNQKDRFSIGELIEAMKMNIRTVEDWLHLYQAFNRGPTIREIKVNDSVVYEVLHEEEKGDTSLEKVELEPKKGIRRSKLQKGVALVAFLRQQEQAFFRSSMEQALGMKPDQSKNWIKLYQIFNNGPVLLEEKLDKDLVVYRVG